MKNSDNLRLLAHKRRVDTERRAQAVLRKQHEQSQPSPLNMPPRRPLNTFRVK